MEKLNRLDQKLNNKQIGHIFEQDNIKYKVCYKNESDFVLIYPTQFGKLKYYVKQLNK